MARRSGFGLWIEGFQPKRIWKRCAAVNHRSITWWAHPKGRLTKYEKQLLELPWQAVREGVEVKLLKEEKEFYVLARSQDRQNKERGMRRGQLKRLWKRLKEIQAMSFSRKTDMVMKLGAAKQQAPSAWRLVQVEIAKAETEISFKFSLRKKKF